MGLYNFKKRFWPFVKDGRKQHTIRKDRVDGYVDTPGLDTCHCYGGLRTKHTVLLGRWPCVKVERIIVFNLAPARIEVNGEELSQDEIEQLAKRDGFKDWKEMADFWREEHALPFHGHIIHWNFKEK